MKKIRISKKFILGIFAGIFISTCLTVAAFTITSQEVTYSPKNSNWKVDNTKDAIDYLYKLTDYEVPTNTYFYDKTTKGETIKRYKKVNNKYYECDQYGNITSGSKEVTVNSSNLVEYKGTNAGNLTAGSAGYANKNFVLGDGSDIETSKYDKRLVLTARAWYYPAVQSGETYHTSTVTTFENFNNEWVDLYIKANYSTTTHGLSSKWSYVDVVGVKDGKDVNIGRADATSTNINESKVFKFNVKEYDTIKLNAHAYARAVGDTSGMVSTWSDFGIIANYEFH